MRAFIAMIWDAREARHWDRITAWTTCLLSRHPTWRIITDAAGLRIMADGAGARQPYLLAQTAGAIVGSVFEKDAPGHACLTSLPSSAVHALQNRDADYLLSAYWGAYVAIWRDINGAVRALRDPSGGAPCYLTSLDGVEILASDIAALDDIASGPFETDPAFVQAFVLNNHLATPRTGLKDVQELLPGQEISWRHGERGKPLWAWNAAAICAAPHDMRFEEASCEIRRIAASCLSQWASVYHCIAVQLSGGLDSSLLLGLLKTAGHPRLIPVHFVGSDYEAQELQLARLVASRNGTPLVELEHTPNAVRLEAMLNYPRLARPTKQLLGAHAQGLLMQAVNDYGADCVVAGHGGDALFLQGALGAHMLDDFVRTRGLHSDLLRVAFDTAVSQELPVTRVLAQGVRSLLHRDRRSLIARERPGDGAQFLLMRDAIEALPDAYFENAWLEDAPDLPPGKLQQLECIIALKDYWLMRGYGQACDELLPFLSQPIVEFALRTPTYVLGEGGIDRRLERHAFRDAIPEDVARRTGKGMINHQLLNILEGNLGFVRQLLLEGDLIRQGWIVRSALEQALTRERFARGDGLEVILNLIVAETWMRSWGR